MGNLLDKNQPARGLLRGAGTTAVSPLVLGIPFGQRIILTR